MEQRNKTGILIGLLTVLLITGGCGWFAGNDYPGSSASDATLSISNQLDTATRLDAPLFYYSHIVLEAVPDEGFLAGGEAVRVFGLFPEVAGAQLQYTVYFGDTIAPYDTSMTPTFSRNNIYVTAPESFTAGPVNIGIVENDTNSYIANNENKYTYLDPFELFEVDPDAGIITGGSGVTLLGRFPISAPITDLATAQSQYRVAFGTKLATNTMNAFGEFVTPGAIYLQTPPGDLPGTVDVTLILDLIYGGRSLTDGFRYLDDFELFSVDPDQGHVSGVNPTVELGGSFPVSSTINDVATAASLYTVYFGYEIASFIKPAGLPVITAEYMYVSPPPSTLAGVVDVNIFAIAGISSRYAQVFSADNNDYEYITFMQLGEVYPDNGFLGIQTPVDILAKLPITQDVTQLLTANSYYTVDFDGVRGSYNVNVNPLIEITNAYGEYNAIMHMLTPPGTVVGPVDVMLNDESEVEFSDILTDGYTYRSVMELVYIYPDRGPTTGGTPVDVLVNIPIDPSLLPISDVATAEGMYAIYIDDNAALFDITRPPLISLNTINAGYNAYFHMITPPGTVGSKLGILRDIYGDAPDATKLDAFEYLSDSSVGEWSSVTIRPNPVGPLAAGELEVVVEVTGTLDGGNVFIVPQGGDPSNQDHRIPLSGSGSTTWTGTNSIAITTSLYGSGVSTLYADGHAAVFIQDGQGDIIGDDFVDATDGGVIATAAQLDRHFIIDTIPPIMAVGLSQVADDSILSLPITSRRLGSYKAEPAGVDPFTHPQPFPGIGFATIEDFPWSSDFLAAVPTLLANPLSQRGIQRFFNVASVSNNLDISEYFRPVVSVTFVDVDIFNHFDHPTAVTSLLNEDRFNPGSTYRAPAGFLFDGVNNFTSTIGTDREILLNAPVNPNLHARWELEGGSTALPDMDFVYGEYRLSGTQITGGYVYQNGLDNTPFNQLTATWDLYNGIDPIGAIDPTRLVIKFAAADRAGIYYPRGNITVPARSIMTRRAHQLDPLQLWWMREVNTDIFRDSIQADETTLFPEFEWTIANEPRPELDSLDPARPLYQYEIWQTPQSANVDDFRDGPYTRVTTSGWGPNNTLFLQGNFNPPLPAENRWYLFVVSSIDEAGNVEQWPAALPIVAGQITVGQTTQQGSNWRRFYYPAGESQIDTRVTPEFFHGTVSLGRDTIIPMPADTTVSVRAEFEGQVISTISGVSTTIDWRITENGNPFGTSTGLTYSVSNLGDPNRLRPFTYVLTAEGSAGTVVDPTPINIRFTVVPEESIADFLNNSQTDDAQPIREFDRN